MEWNRQQEKALRDVDRWLKDPSGDQVYRLFGFAGTGKTTLAKEIAANANGIVHFGAFTGKAAHVLRTKGCHNATTVHSLIYHTSEKSQVRYTRLCRELEELRQPEEKAKLSEKVWHQKVLELEKKIHEEYKRLNKPTFSLNEDSVLADASLLILDECSMIDGYMADDLMKFGCRILVLGDPFQLPPIGAAGYFTKGKPNSLLTDVVRQAKGNPILALAEDIRVNQRCREGSYGESSVISTKPPASTIMGCDQLLVGRNKTRTSCNRRFRHLLGYEDPLPVADDKVVCLRNNHDIGLMNGALWKVESVPEFEVDTELGRMVLNLTDESSSLALPETICHTGHFLGNFDMPWWERKEAEEFDYGYALTTHKAQGSQWPSVVVFDEGTAFRESRWQWLYTAVTRASEKIVVVK